MKEQREPRIYANTRITEEILNSGIGYLDLPQHIHYKLWDAGIHTVLDLLYCCPRTNLCRNCEERNSCSKIRLLAIKQLGKKGLDEIYKAFERKGIVRRVDAKSSKGIRSGS